MNRHPTGTSDECDICEGFTRFWLMFYSRGFHKLDEIASNANVGIRGFTTWKQKISGNTPYFCYSSKQSLTLILQRMKENYNFM